MSCIAANMGLIDDLSLHTSVGPPSSPVGTSGEVEEGTTELLFTAWWNWHDSNFFLYIGIRQLYISIVSFILHVLHKYIYIYVYIYLDGKCNVHCCIAVHLPTAVASYLTGEDKASRDAFTVIKMHNNMSVIKCIIYNYGDTVKLPIYTRPSITYFQTARYCKPITHSGKSQC